MEDVMITANQLAFRTTAALFFAFTALSTNAQPQPGQPDAGGGGHSIYQTDDGNAVNKSGEATKERNSNTNSSED